MKLQGARRGRLTIWSEGKSKTEPVAHAHRTYSIHALKSLR